VVWNFEFRINSYLNKVLFFYYPRSQKLSEAQIFAVDYSEIRLFSLDSCFLALFSLLYFLPTSVFSLRSFSPFPLKLHYREQKKEQCHELCDTGDIIAVLHIKSEF